MRVPGMRRKLTEEDLVRMRVPARYTRASLEGCCGEGVDGKPSIRAIVETYIAKFDEMVGRGVGLMLWGNNDIGKTGAAVVLAKEARRRGMTVLIATAEGLRSGVLNKTRFDMEQTLWDRALEVDFLVLDDLAKEHRDAQGFGERLFEDLIRQRSGALKTTMITSNMSPEQMQSGEFAYKPSMLKVMRENTVPVKCAAPESWNRRSQAGVTNKMAMTG